MVACSRSALIRIGLSRYRRVCDVLNARWYSSDAVQTVSSQIVSSLCKLSRNENIPKQDPIPVSPPPGLGTRNETASKQSPIPMSPPSSSGTRNKTDSSNDAASVDDFEEATPPDVSSSNSSFFGSMNIVDASKTKNLQVPTTDSNNPSQALNINSSSDESDKERKSMGTSPLNVTIERGTSPAPLTLDVGTCTGPVMVEMGVSTLPELKDVATTTSCSQLLEEEKSLTESSEQNDHQQGSKELPPLKGHSSIDEQSGELTVGMLTEPTHRSTPRPLSVEGSDCRISTSKEDSDGRERGSYLPHIGERVLARWTDDGWYYKGMYNYNNVRNNCS